MLACTYDPVPPQVTAVSDLRIVLPPLLFPMPGSGTFRVEQEEA